MHTCKVFSDRASIIAHLNRLQIVSIECINSITLTSKVSFFLHKLLLCLVVEIVPEVITVGNSMWNLRTSAKAIGLWGSLIVCSCLSSLIDWNRLINLIMCRLWRVSGPNWIMKTHWIMVARLRYNFLNRRAILWLVVVDHCVGCTASRLLSYASHTFVTS